MRFPLNARGLVLAASLFFSASSAFAGEGAAPVGRGRKTTLLPVASPQTDNAGPAAARVEAIIEQVIRKSPRFELIDAADRFDPAGHQERKEMADRGNDALVFGRKSYEGLEEGLGLESFDRAISSFQESALWENLRGYTRALAMRILVKWSDDQPTAKREIGALLLLDPKAELPKDLLSPDLSAEIAHQREALAATPRSSFDVTTTPVSSRIFVDGVFRGTTPGSVKDLYVGDHFLSLVAPGYEVAQQQIHVVPGATLTVALKPADKGRPFLKAADRIARSIDKPEEAAAAQALGHLAASDEILATGVSRHSGLIDIEVHRIQAKDGHAAAAIEISELAETDPEFAAKIAKRLAEVLGLDHPHCDKGVPCSVAEVQGRSGRNLSSAQTGAIATVVLGAALIATGIGLGIDAKLQSDAFTKLPQTDPAIISKGHAVLVPAVASDICNGLGLVSLGIWAYLAFGLPAQHRAEIPTPAGLDAPHDSTPPVDTKPDTPKKKEEDPFETKAPAPLPASSLAFVAGPQSGGFAFAVVGSF